MSRRPSKPVKLKERSGLTEIFNTQAHTQSLPSVAQDDDATPLALGSDPALGRELEKVTVGTAVDQSPSKATTRIVSAGATATRSAHSATTQTKVPRSAEASARSRGSEGDRNKIFAIGLLLAFVVIATFALDKQSGGEGMRSVREARDRLLERVDFHRVDTGIRLNRERVQVDLENQLTAPRLEGVRPIPKERDPVLSGIPLQQETHHRSSSRERSVPVNPDYPDARVMYSVEEELAAQRWEEQAREQYVRDFIANAARAGYSVEVDRWGRVKVKGRLDPSTMPPSSVIDSTPGMSR